MQAMNESDWLLETAEYEAPPFAPPPMPGDVRLLEGIAAGLQLYYTPVLAVPGLVGNVLCVAAIGRHGARAGSGDVYAAALILMEALQLLLLLHDWAAEMGADLYALNGWCHLVTLLKKASEFLCQWYLVLLMADCYVTSCHTPRSSTTSGRAGSTSGWCTTSRARVITVGVAVLALVVFLNISLTYHVYRINAQRICHLQSQFRGVFYHLDILNVVVNVIVPCVLVITLVVRLIIWFTCQASRRLTNSEERVSDYLLYGIMHSVIWLPLQLLQIAFMLQKFTASHDSHVAQFRAMFWTKTISYVSYTNMALNAVILLLLNATLRRTVMARLTALALWYKGSSRGYYGHHVVGSAATQHGTAIEVASPSEDEAER